MNSKSSRTLNIPTSAWILLALLLLPANLLYLYNLRPSTGLVAEMGSEKLYRKQLSPYADKAIRQMESAAHSTLVREAEEWAYKMVIEKEAKRTNRTSQQWVADEVNSKAKVTDADVMNRFRQSPEADAKPFADAKRDMSQILQMEQIGQIRRAALSDLANKEGFRVIAAPPANYTPPTYNMYPVYTPPSTADRGADGRITGPSSKGSINAPVVVEIYSDFFCPFSRKLATITNELEAKYPGDLRVVFRHFPLPMHKGADVLAEATVCAQEQGKFWEMHDALMEWSGPVELAKLEEAAQKIGLNASSFSACMTEGRYKNFVAQEVQQAQQRGVGSTPTFFLNGRKAVGALPTETITKAIDWFKSPEGEYPLRQFNPANRPPSQQPSAQPVDDGKPVTFAKEWLAAGPVSGPADAPITLIEFIDYNCPFCQKGAQAVKPLLDSLKTPLRFYSKQFPLPMHPNAEKGAVAALCANEQGKYWAFREEVFGASWGKQTPDDLKAVASKVGLDRASFDKCLDSSATLDLVKKDITAGSATGVQGTPTFFVNGHRVVGANPDTLKKLFDEAVAPPKK